MKGHRDYDRDRIVGLLAESQLDLLCVRDSSGGSAGVAWCGLLYLSRAEGNEIRSSVCPVVADRHRCPQHTNQATTQQDHRKPNRQQARATAVAGRSETCGG
nr:hypothetical protein [Kribbella catacumbae]